MLKLYCTKSRNVWTTFFFLLCYFTSNFHLFDLRGMCWNSLEKEEWKKKISWEIPYFLNLKRNLEAHAFVYFTFVKCLEIETPLKSELILQTRMFVIVCFSLMLDISGVFSQTLAVRLRYSLPSTTLGRTAFILWCCAPDRKASSATHTWEPGSPGQDSCQWSPSPVSMLLTNKHPHSPFVKSTHHTLKTNHTYPAKSQGLLHPLVFVLQLNTDLISAGK